MPDYKSRFERRQAQAKTPKQKKPPKKGLFKKIVLSVVVLIVLLGISGIIAVAAMIHSAPALKATDLKTPVATKIYFNDGTLMTTVGSDNRSYAPINKIPDIVKEAFISTEDTRFYQHFGIDPYRIGGAIVANFTHGFGAQGGSTITQQVVKNDVLTSHKTITRKVQEAYLAIKLEQEYSKDQILEMYLNTIFLGDRSYGVATAAQDYFGLSVDQLKNISIAQAAMLAALPKAPSYYDPTRNPEAALQRRNLVLDLMVKNKAISQADADKAKKVSIKDMLKKGSGTKKNKRNYDAVVDLIESQYVGDGKQISKDDFYQGGLKIQTTIDRNVQTTIENVLNDDANFASAKKNIQAGIASVDTQTGAILGIGGGRHYTNGTNWALSGDTYNGTGNQIGSTAKPLVDYGPAIEYLKWPTVHTLKDEPYKYPGGKNSVGEWDGRYWGDMTIERALIWSRNVPAAKTLHELDTSVGKSKIIDYDGKLGIKFNSNHYNESYSIGSFTANPLEIAGAYATYGNNGVYNAPHAIKSVDYPDGRHVKFDHDEHVAFHDYTAYMVTDMLKGVTQTPTTYPGPSLAGYPIVGKSGSTNVSPELAKAYNLSSYEMNKGNVDEWFTGYSPKITTSVWTGYVRPKQNDGKSGIVLMGLDQQHIAGNLFGKIMLQITSKDTPYWRQPNSVVRASIEKSTGLLASPTTPKSDIVSGLFVKGSVPTQVSTKYKKLDPPKNVKATYNQADNTVSLTWDYANQQGVTFEVDQNTDSGYQPIGNSNQHNFTINNLQPGTDYEFAVIANYTDSQDASKNQKSDPTTVKVTIPGPIDPATDPNQKKNQNQDQGQNQNPGTDQGTGNTTGTDSGTPNNGATGGTGTNSGTGTSGTSTNSQSMILPGNPAGLDSSSNKKK
ncbi:MAG TPA: transglycosylase domain-containing protein [Candidatus Angelobacter sp.]|nr:transglycosylase domain-containing protein [Candidatus Angelobacter sp.]